MGWCRAQTFVRSLKVKVTTEHKIYDLRPYTSHRRTWLLHKKWTRCFSLQHITIFLAKKSFIFNSLNLFYSISEIIWKKHKLSKYKLDMSEIVWRVNACLSNKQTIPISIKTVSLFCWQRHDSILSFEFIYFCIFLLWKNNSFFHQQKSTVKNTNQWVTGK